MQHNTIFDKLDFLRMDVEGYEAKIISGGRCTIERFKPILCIEIHTSRFNPKGTVDLLLSLKNLGYDAKYCVPRELDFPLIGSMKDVQKIGIAQVIEKLTKGRLPYCFQLFLINTHDARGT